MKSVSKKENGLEKWLKEAKKDGFVLESSNPDTPKNEENEKVGAIPTGKEPRDILPKGRERVRYFGAKKHKPLYERFMEQFPCVGDWLRHKLGGTKGSYGNAFLAFCREANILPDDFGKMEMFKARDLAWKHIEITMRRTAARASVMMKSCTSFYRYYNKGVKLPFDTQKGGHHKIVTPRSQRRNKFRWGTIDEARELIFAIIDQTTNLRDKMMYTLAVSTGIRENAFWDFKWKDFEQRIDVNGEQVIVIKVTPELDQKIEGYRFDFYYAFLSGYALKLFEQYEQKYRGNRGLEDYVFYTLSSSGLFEEGRKMSRERASKTFRQLVDKCKKKGIVPKGRGDLWFHLLRALFKKFVRNSPITDDEYKEFIMGHVLPGSREAYADRDPIELAKEYLKINFSPPIEYLKRKFKEEQRKREELEIRVTELEIEQTGPTQLRRETHTAYKAPSFEDVPSNLTVGPIAPKRPVVQTVESSINRTQVEIGPPPKACLRRLDVKNMKDDSYCHTFCKEHFLTEYKGCQEAKKENPELFG